MLLAGLSGFEQKNRQQDAGTTTRTMRPVPDAKS